MSTRKKILLGCITILPLIHIFVIISLFIVAFTSAFLLDGFLDLGSFFPGFKALFALHLCVIPLIIGLEIFYIITIFRNDRLQQNEKFFWAIAIFVGTIIAMPIYWYLHVWAVPKSNRKT
ncbi:MAG: hypothetical protein V1799_01455 [bacterium]